MLPNSVQAQTSAASLIAFAAGYASSQHWLGLGADAWGTIFTGAMLFGTAVWPVVVTRLQSLKTEVGKSGAIVVTNPQSAAASPSPNVVAPNEVNSAKLTQAQ